MVAGRGSPEVAEGPRQYRHISRDEDGLEQHAHTCTSLHTAHRCAEFTEMLLGHKAEAVNRAAASRDIKTLMRQLTEIVGMALSNLDQLQLAQKQSLV